MSEPTPGLRAIVLAAIVLCIVASITGAKAGDDKPSGLRVATVDPKKLLSEYKFTVSADNDLRKKQDTILATLQAWAQHPLLSEAEQKALGDLIVQEKSASGLDNGQKDKQKKLLEQSKQLVDDFNALQQKQVGALTPQDKDKINTYTRLASETDTRINTRKRDAEEELQKQLNSNTTKVLKDVRDNIAKIAKEKGYNLVFSNEVVWYADNDITDTVLNQLNK